MIGGRRPPWRRGRRAAIASSVLVRVILLPSLGWVSIPRLRGQRGRVVVEAVVSIEAAPLSRIIIPTTIDMTVAAISGSVPVRIHVVALDEAGRLQVLLMMLAAMILVPRVMWIGLRFRRRHGLVVGAGLLHQGGRKWRPPGGCRYRRGGGGRRHGSVSIASTIRINGSIAGILGL